MNRRKYFLSCAILACLATGCETNTPLDAETRMMIDSTVASQINYARREMDSLCIAYEKTALPGMIDSIKKVRLRQIEAQLQKVPK